MPFTSPDTDLLIDRVHKKSNALLGHRARVEVGGRDSRKAVPNVNVSFDRVFPDEYFFNVNAPDVLVPYDHSPVITGSLFSIPSPFQPREDRYYVDSSGDLEYEIELKEKPASNKIVLSISCSPSLRFVHQVSLTQDEIDRGAFRPEDVVNSYAVYSDRKHGVYQTGKVAHIKRSHVIDRKGTVKWCSQDISVNRGTGLWTIVIPEEVYEDDDLYPLVIGPTLGLTTQGASTGTLSNNGDAVFTNLGSPPDNGSINYIVNWYVNADNPSRFVKPLFIYDDGGTPTVTHVGPAVGFGGCGPSGCPGVDFTISGDSISSSEEYYSGFVILSSDTGYLYDSDGGYDVFIDESAGFDSPPSTLVKDVTESGRRMSSYIDYDVVVVTTTTTTTTSTTTTSSTTVTTTTTSSSTTTTTSLFPYFGPLEVEDLDTEYSVEDLNTEYSFDDVSDETTIESSDS